MDARRKLSAPMKNRTTVERKSERELVITRTFNGPARIVFEAWTKPELLKRWWVPKSIGVSLLSCETDVRVGGEYRFEFGREGSKPMAFFGEYLEVVPHSRLVWTNEESEDGAVTTVTFEDKGGKTLLVMHELYPSKEALDRSIEGMEGGHDRDIRATGRASRHPRRERGTGHDVVDAVWRPRRRAWEDVDVNAGAPAAGSTPYRSPSLSRGDPQADSLRSPPVPRSRPDVGWPGDGRKGRAMDSECSRDGAKIACLPGDLRVLESFVLDVSAPYGHEDPLRRPRG